MAFVEIMNMSSRKYEIDEAVIESSNVYTETCIVVVVVVVVVQSS